MKRQTEPLNFHDLALFYCSLQDNTPASLEKTLADQYSRFRNTGWMVLECQMMDSSQCGQITLMPYGPGNSYKTVPDRPISPRGLASDMSIVLGFMPSAVFLEGKDVKGFMGALPENPAHVFHVPVEYESRVLGLRGWCRDEAQRRQMLTYLEWPDGEREEFRYYPPEKPKKGRR